MQAKHLDNSDCNAMGDFCMRLSKRLAPVPPDRLWHYTTAKGLIGILESKCLRASHISGMNDAYEFRYSVGSLQQAIDFRLKMAKPLNPDVRSMFETLRNALRDMKMEDVPPIFVSCFTQEVDLTNHWGEYGDRGRGYAVGFSSTDLLLAGREQGLFFLKCMYDNEETAEVMSEIVVFAENFFTEVRRKNLNVPLEELSQDFLRYYTWNLAFFAPSFKSPTFVHESEWRVTHRVADFDYSRMSFIAKGSEIRAQISFSLLQKNPPTDLVPISEIYIGPVRLELDKDLAEIAVRSLLRKHGYPESIGVHRSNSTYRG